MDKKRLTSENGKPIADNQNIQTAGVRGPAMLQDVWYLEKLAHFDREVIPERRMHAKGSGAFGTFTVTHDITKYTRASIFSQVGKKTDCLVRFSTVAGERGAADAERGDAVREERNPTDLEGEAHEHLKRPVVQLLVDALVTDGTTVLPPLDVSFRTALAAQVHGGHAIGMPSAEHAALLARGVIAVGCRAGGVPRASVGSKPSHSEPFDRDIKT